MRLTGLGLGAIPLMLTLGGCATPNHLEEQFGQSVRMMTEAQRYTPPGAAPPDAGAATMDGNKAAAILDAYRTDVAKPKESRDEIRIRVGQ